MGDIGERRVDAIEIVDAARVRLFELLRELLGFLHSRRKRSSADICTATSDNSTPKPVQSIITNARVMERVK